MFKPLGIDHIVLRVRDQARSQRFYEDVLGCTLAKLSERISLIHLRFGDAIREAIAEEMRRDETIVLMGEDVAEAGTTFKVLKGLVRRTLPDAEALTLAELEPAHA